MIGDFTKGVRYLLSGFQLITQPGLRPFVLIPLLVNILLFTMAIWYGTNAFEGYIESLLPSWLMWLSWLLWPLFTFAFMIIVFYSFTLIANLIAAPFNGLLAEKVQLKISNINIPESNMGDIIKSIIPSLIVEIKKLFYFVLWSIPFLVLFFIPVLNIAAPFLWIAFSAWMLSLEYTDFSANNNKVFFPQLRQLFKTRRFLALGFGGMALVCTMVPILNFVIIPVAVAGATRLWLEELTRNQE
ncbi:MAG: sulfate transporter CysZ [Gammaproteobacteria bacterium]|nr:sulfate transporter CysZ [Gammaproteobacteria bacterium]